MSQGSLRAAGDRPAFFMAQPPHPAALHSHRQMVPKVPPAAPISPVSDTSILLQRHTQPQQARSAGGEASRVSKVLVRRWERLEPSVWSPASGAQRLEPSVWSPASGAQRPASGGARLAVHMWCALLVGGGRGARRREARRQLRIDRAVLALLTDGSTTVVVEHRFDVRKAWHHSQVA